MYSRVGDNYEEAGNEGTLSDDDCSLAPPAIIKNASNKSIAGINVTTSDFITSSSTSSGTMVIHKSKDGGIPWYLKHMVLPYQTRNRDEHYYVQLCIEDGIVQIGLKEHLKSSISLCGMFLDVTCSAPWIICNPTKLQKIINNEPQFNDWERMVIPQALEAYVKDTHTAYGTDKDKPLQYTSCIPLPKEVD